MHELHLIVVIAIDIDLFVTHFQVIQGKFPAIFSRIRRSYAGQNGFLHITFSINRRLAVATLHDFKSTLSTSANMSWIYL
jgi:hypothetical protein